MRSTCALTGQHVTEDADLPAAVDDLPAQRAFRLVTHEEDGALGPRDVAHEVMLDAPAGAHAGPCHDDRAAGDPVDRLGFLGASRHDETGKLEGGLMLPDEPRHVRVEILGPVAEDVGHTGRHGAVEEDEEVGDAVRPQQGVQVVEHLLGALDGEAGDDDVSPSATVRVMILAARHRSPRHCRAAVAVAWTPSARSRPGRRGWDR